MRRISTLLDGRKTVVIEQSTLVSDAVRLMSEHQIGAVPVLAVEQTITVVGDLIAAVLIGVGMNRSLAVIAVRVVRDVVFRCRTVPG